MGSMVGTSGVYPDITNCLDRSFVSAGRNHVLVPSGTRLMVVVTQSRTQTGGDVATVCVVDLLSTYRRGDERDGLRKHPPFDLRLNTAVGRWEVFDPESDEAAPGDPAVYKTERRPALINAWTHTVQCEGGDWRERLQTVVGRNVIRAQHRPRCPSCAGGAPLVVRYRGDDSAQFFGCKNFRPGGCTETVDVDRAFEPRTTRGTSKAAA